MSKDRGEAYCGVGTPVLGDDDCRMVSLAARAQDLITHYPDFGDRREANAVVGACGRKLLNGQTHRRPLGKTEGPIRMAPATLNQRALLDGRQPATNDNCLIGNWLRTSHQRPSLASRAGRAWWS